MENVGYVMIKTIDNEIENCHRELKRLSLNHYNYNGLNIISNTKKTIDKQIKVSNRIESLYKLRENLTNIDFKK